MTAFNHLEPRPADALLGLMAAFRADPRTDKVDLGVGIYRNDEGETPIMTAVREAEVRLAQESTTKAYEGPKGNIDFAEAVAGFIFGSENRPEGYESFATPGGTGGLGLAMNLVKRTRPSATVWMSGPTWPNHPHVGAMAGLKSSTFRYASAGVVAADVDGMLSDLSAATSNDAVLIQGPCHNPTGVDLDTESWVAVGKLCADRNLLPVIDIAYHGFGEGLDQDLAGVQAFLAEVPDAILTYSCSKNFGLYRDRVGALVVKTDSVAAAGAVRTHISDIARGLYSMPPAHGQAVVASILADQGLRKTWETELVEMQQRMASLRAKLADALDPASGKFDTKALTNQKGMFSQLPFVDGGVDALRDKGLYIPGSGRINIAGMKSADIPRIAELMSPYL